MYGILAEYSQSTLDIDNYSMGKWKFRVMFDDNV